MVVSIIRTNLQVSRTPFRVQNFANILRTFREQRAEPKVLKTTNPQLYSNLISIKISNPISLKQSQQQQ